MDESPEDSTVASSAPRLPWRLLTCSVAVIGSTVIAALAWSSHDQPGDRVSDETQSHQLTADQAACLRFGFVTSRSDARFLGTVLGSYSTIDPEAARYLQTEVTALDGIAMAYPHTDYRLVQSIAVSADAGAAVLAVGGLESYRAKVAERAQAISETSELCRTLAGFDTSTLAIADGSGSDG